MPLAVIEAGSVTKRCEEREKEITRGKVITGDREESEEREREREMGKRSIAIEISRLITIERLR